MKLKFSTSLIAILLTLSVAQAQFKLGMLNC